ncbi:MAG: 7-cyano-7-deazaguanine synthase [Candidatus Woesearchaeota archaeon]
MKGVLLLSGGFDSPVAGYLMKKEGIEIIAIHFSLEPFTDDSAEKKSIELAKKLGIKKIYVIKQGDVHAEIIEKCKHKYYYIIGRRIMWRIAEKIAKKEKCDFLITGENLGQVGSQTLDNMSVIDSAVKIKILRPLLCKDKVEIINLAKQITTYEVSCGPEMCCVLGPKHPATKSKLEDIQNEEKKLNIKKIINKSLKETKKIDL